MAATDVTPELSRALKPRHLTMISIGGIIGAGLFVGSSAAIAATGPAIVLSYALTGVLILLVMRMIGEMAMAHPGQRAFTEFARIGLGRWAGFPHRLAVLVFLDDRRAHRGHRRREHPAALAAHAGAVGDRARSHGGDDRREPHVRALLRRIRVLVRVHQGGGHHRVHRARGGLRVRLESPLAGRRSPTSPRTAASCRTGSSRC